MPTRRQFLTSTASTLLLPFLPRTLDTDLSTRGEARRYVFIFAPNGMKMDDWTPEQEGTLKSLPFLLEPLDALKNRTLVLSGLTLDGGRAHGDGPGDHARAAASYLTCAHPVKTEGSGIRAGRSIDQELADLLKAPTPFSSLELGMEGGKLSGRCDSGYSCAYTHSISWRTAVDPNPKESDPIAFFERLFGPLGGDPDQVSRRRTRASILDLVQQDARRLQKSLGDTDRQKLDAYLESVRSIEKRLQAEEKAGPAVDPPSGLRERRRGAYKDRLALSYELIELALRTDRTRVLTFMLGNAGSNRSYRWVGVPEGHHDLSHHKGKAHNLKQIRKINRFHLESFAAFLDRLALPDAEGKSLLDNTTVMFGSGLGDGNRHQHHNLPILLAGGDRWHRLGRHLKFKSETPLANLYLQLLRQAGGRHKSFADSSAPLTTS